MRIFVALMEVDTLASLIAEQGLISTQEGKIFEINKRTGPNKCTGFKKVMKNITYLYMNGQKND